MIIKIIVFVCLYIYVRFFFYKHMTAGRIINGIWGQYILTSEKFERTVLKINEYHEP